MTEKIEQPRPRILVLGGGYGGLRATLGLQKKLGGKAEITLISKHDYHYQTTLLHKVAIGTLSSRKARIFYRKILDKNRVNFIKDKVLNIDPKRRLVECRKATHGYDYLVIALGFKPESFGIEGVDKYAHKLSSLNAALKLTKSIENKFKDFSLTGERDDLRFIICGTGFTSIEFAAELASQLDDLCEISGIDRSIPEIICIGRGRILPVFSDKIAAIAQKKLERMGVKIISNASVVECRKNAVVVDAGGAHSVYHGNTILWGAGVRGSDIVEKSPLPNKRGRIAVDAHLRCPDFPEIFVVGDCALAADKDMVHAPTAQLSAQMGDYVADFLAHKILKGRDLARKFAFVHRGTICSIGHTNGVGVVYGAGVSGEVAAFMKNTIENRWLMSIGGLSMVFRKGQFRFRSSN